jgi:hypothetical protein
MATKPRVIDLSERAVANRIEDLRQLYRLMLTFKDVKILGPLKDLEPR